MVQFTPLGFSQDVYALVAIAEPFIIPGTVLGIPSGDFGQVAYLDVDDDGNIFAGILLNSSSHVVKLNSTGNVNFTITLGSFGLHDVKVYSSGNILIGDAAESRPSRSESGPGWRRRPSAR